MFLCVPSDQPGAAKGSSLLPIRVAYSLSEVTPSQPLSPDPCNGSRPLGTFVRSRSTGVASSDGLFPQLVRLLAVVDTSNAGDGGAEGRSPAVVVEKSTADDADRGEG